MKAILLNIMSIRSLSDIIRDVQSTLDGEEIITLSEILEAFHERGFGFILLIFALPMALPIPVPPGINILLATPLLLLTAQQALGRHTLWMPKKMEGKTISSPKFTALLEKTLPFLEKIELLLKPRLAPITQGISSNIIGSLGFLMALAVCVPLPLTNTVPSLGISMMAIGVLSRDGLAVLAGVVIGMLWIIMLVLAFLFLGAEGIDFIKETIKTFL